MAQMRLVMQLLHLLPNKIAMALLKQDKTTAQIWQVRILAQVNPNRC
jgi:hypothetical protein